MYVLFSRTCGKRYVGQTDDLERRVGEHNDPSRNSR
ncbi:MAG: GIY-YIG nuclease family protein, partial [Planctomycetota bacterium]